MEKIKDLDIKLIAPSRGPVYPKPGLILGAYRDWVSDKAKNEAIIAFVSMHGSTRRMVDHLVDSLRKNGITVKPFNLTQTDVGALAVALVDAATLVIASPTVLVGPHPNVVYAVHLANVLRPKLKFAAVIGSYGWGGKMMDQITKIITNLKVELLQSILVKGHPKEEYLRSLDRLAEQILKKHKEGNIC